MGQHSSKKQKGTIQHPKRPFKQWPIGLALTPMPPLRHPKTHFEGSLTNEAQQGGFTPKKHLF
jgi:hypothetical protein